MSWTASEAPFSAGEPGRLQEVALYLCINMHVICTPIDAIEQQFRRQAARLFPGLANAELFRVLGEPARIRLVAVLFSQDRSVTSCHLSQPQNGGMVSCSEGAASFL